MTQSELWKIYCKKNPQFEGNGNVTMTAKGLKKLFDTTWGIAMYQGEEEPVEKTDQSFQQSTQRLHHLMSIFGMK